MIYVTLGTIFNVISGDLFHRLLAGVSDLPADVIVTVGDTLDPVALGPQPPNVHIAQYIPLSQVLPKSDLVISHAGSGTMTGALSYGIPQMVVPIFADQFWNADRAEALGFGVRLNHRTLTPDEVREAVSAMLGNDEVRRNARRIQAEIAAMPPVSTVVPAIERLVANHSSTYA